MKITALKSFVHTAGNYFIKVETDAGLYGLGEAGLKRRGHAIAEVVKGFESDLIGADPSRIEHLWQTMFRCGFFPGGVVQSSAVSAVDIALWDLKGKALGVPVYELLGGLTRESVACYPHIGERDAIERLVANCRQRQSEGWRLARWGLSDPKGEGAVFEPARAVRHGIEQVKAVREACGDDFGICVDLHTRLDPPAAIEFCRGVEPYRPFFVEDPLRSENPQSLRMVRQQTSVPIAVGEHFDSKWSFRQVIEEDLMDYCRIDLCIAGGLTEGKKITGWCETHYIHIAPHNPLGPVSTAACLHLWLASPLVGVQELPSVPGTTMTDVFPKQVPFADGHLLIPDGPGLGVEFNEEAFAGLDPYQPGKGRYFLRDDGSYTNW